MASIGPLFSCSTGDDATEKILSGWTALQESEGADKANSSTDELHSSSASNPDPHFEKTVYEPLDDQIPRSLRLIRIDKSLSPQGLIQCFLSVYACETDEDGKESWHPVQTKSENDPSHSARSRALQRNSNNADSKNGPTNTSKHYVVPATRGEGPYQALSYVWGPADDQQIIQVNGINHKVGRNLWAFLDAARELDNEFMELAWWIDALCINQDDLHEKGHQVALMGWIYSHAQRVVVWPGLEPPVDVTLFEIACKAVRFMCDYPDCRDIGAVLNQVDKSVSWTTARFREEFWRFAGLEYWSRVWVRQEAKLALRLYILLNGVSYNLDILTALALVASDEIMDKKVDDVTLTQKVAWNLLRTRVHRPREEAEYMLNRRDVFLSAVFLECTNPRDGLYSQLSIMDGGSEFEIDYSENLLSFYLRAMMLLQKGNERFDLKLNIVIWSRMASRLGLVVSPQYDSSNGGQMLRQLEKHGSRFVSFKDEVCESSYSWDQHEEYCLKCNSRTKKQYIAGLTQVYCIKNFVGYFHIYFAETRTSAGTIHDLEVHFDRVWGTSQQLRSPCGPDGKLMLSTPNLHWLVCLDNFATFHRLLEAEKTLQMGQAHGKTPDNVPCTPSTDPRRCYRLDRGEITHMQVKEFLRSCPQAREMIAALEAGEN